MDNRNLEERLTRLEERLATIDNRLSSLDHRTIRAWEMHDVRVLKVELQVRNIEARVKEVGERALSQNEP